MTSGTPSEAAEFLLRLCRSPNTREELPRTAFVFAHPDDETVGASYVLKRVKDPCFVYVTDGAPRDGQDAKASGFATSGAYARARQSELGSVLREAGHPSPRIHFFDIPDQQAAENITGIARQLFQILLAEPVDVVFTHPYEGGHPDHDSTAFAVHAARAMLLRDHAHAPFILESTSYHNRKGAFGFGNFIPYPNDHQVLVPLTPDEREFKRRLVACYPSQQRVLRSISMDTERFRPAPTYDFEQPPHRGQLLYELIAWNMTGARWRRLAGAALDELGLDSQSLARSGQAVMSAR